MTNIFVDMDNVLANFSYRDDSVLLYREKGFFKTLPPIVDNINGVKRLLRMRAVRVYIITAIPNRRAKRDKLVWLKEFMPFIKRSHVIFCKEGGNKSKYVGAKRGILLDDYCINIQQWLQKENNYASLITNNYGINEFITYELGSLLHSF